MSSVKINNNNRKRVMTMAHRYMSSIIQSNKKATAEFLAQMWSKILKAAWAQIKAEVKIAANTKPYIAPSEEEQQKVQEFYSRNSASLYRAHLCD